MAARVSIVAKDGSEFVIPAEAGIHPEQKKPGKDGFPHPRE
jgi:hypothetical protein